MFYDNITRQPSKFDPKDWKIIETSPGGVDLDFVNRKTGESTWYTPEGMSGAEIFAIRGARKYWVNVEDVEEYIKKKAAQKAKNGGKDYMDAIAELEASKDVSKKGVSGCVITNSSVLICV